MFLRAGGRNEPDGDGGQSSWDGPESHASAGVESLSYPLRLPQWGPASLIHTLVGNLFDKSRRRYTVPCVPTRLRVVLAFNCHNVRRHVLVVLCILLMLTARCLVCCQPGFRFVQWRPLVHTNRLRRSP